MQEYKLVTMSANWADEINFHSTDVITIEEANALQNSEQWPITMVWGSNEDGKVDLGDFSFEDVPDGLDPKALQKLLGKAGVTGHIGSAIDSLNEKEYEANEVIFNERFKKAFLVLPLEAIHDMEKSHLLNEKFTHNRGKPGNWKAFEREWKDFEKRWGLNKVEGHSDHGYASATFRLVTEAMEQASQ